MNDEYKILCNLMTPEQIEEMSCGEITQEESVSLRTMKPIPGGIMCEKIFGPVKSLTCGCTSGGYKGLRWLDYTCEKCGVTVQYNKVRSSRMGHIDLAYPIIHPLFVKEFAMLLNLNSEDMGNLLTGVSMISVDAGDTLPLKNGTTIDLTIVPMSEKHDVTWVTAYEVLSNIDPDAYYEVLRDRGNDEVATLLYKLNRGSNELKSLMLTKLLVLPPNLRPLIKMESGLWSTSDFNDLYLRVVRRNIRVNKLKKFKKVPNKILNYEACVCQDAINDLFHNKNVTSKGRLLTSLLTGLGGKDGRIRGNLLGKRLDFSGRGIVVSDPSLQFDEILIPQKMACELLSADLIREVKKVKKASYEKIKTMVKEQDPFVIELMWEKFNENRWILINRQPSLHRGSIMAFRMKFHSKKHIGFHPMAVAPFNADFDGDQVAVYLPHQKESLQECRDLMAMSNNVISPSDGQPWMGTNQEMVYGLYYITKEVDEESRPILVTSTSEALMRIQDGTPISRRCKIRRNGKVIDSTFGKCLLLDILPEEIDVTEPWTKKVQKKMIKYLHDNYPIEKVTELMQKFMELGFEWSTKSGLSISVDTIKELEVDRSGLEKIRRSYYDDKRDMELDTATPALDLEHKMMDRKNKMIIDWQTLFDNLVDEMLSKDNALTQMAKSGARGSKDQLSQLTVGKGLIAKPDGTVIDQPILNSLTDGLDIQEYFLSCHGARKGLADKGLSTAKSGFITRKLVEGARDLTILSEDCGSNVGLPIERERANGRVLLNDTNGVPKGTMISSDHDLPETVIVRSPVTCQDDQLCQKCYGNNPSYPGYVQLGENVGVIAAHALSEPLTQMTLRTFHTGGQMQNVGDGDETQDVVSQLPHLNTYFELSKPKKAATITSISGTVSIITDMEKGVPNYHEVLVTSDTPGVADKTYTIPYRTRLIVKDGQKVSKYQKLTVGLLNVNELWHLQTFPEFCKTFVTGLRSIYETEGISVADIHYEVQLRAQTNYKQVIDPGDSSMLPGEVVPRKTKTKLSKLLLLGISQVSLKNESWLHACSFGWIKDGLRGAVINAKVSGDNNADRIMSGRHILAGLVVNENFSRNYRQDREEEDACNKN